MKFRLTQRGYRVKTRKFCHKRCITSLIKHLSDDKKNAYQAFHKANSDAAMDGAGVRSD